METSLHIPISFTIVHYRWLSQRSAAKRSAAVVEMPLNTTQSQWTTSSHWEPLTTLTQQFNSSTSDTAACWPAIYMQQHANTWFCKQRANSTCRKQEMQIAASSADGITVHRVIRIRVSQMHYDFRWHRASATIRHTRSDIRHRPHRVKRSVWRIAKKDPLALINVTYSAGMYWSQDLTIKQFKQQKYYMYFIAVTSRIMTFKNVCFGGILFRYA